MPNAKSPEDVIPALLGRPGQVSKRAHSRDAEPHTVVNVGPIVAKHASKHNGNKVASIQGLDGHIQDGNNLDISQICFAGHSKGATTYTSDEDEN
jgi:hypothetical protein